MNKTLKHFLVVIITAAILAAPIILYHGLAVSETLYWSRTVLFVIPGWFIDMAFLAAVLAVPLSGYWLKGHGQEDSYLLISFLETLILVAATLVYFIIVWLMKLNLRHPFGPDSDLLLAVWCLAIPQAIIMIFASFAYSFRQIRKLKSEREEFFAIWKIHWFFNLLINGLVLFAGGYEIAAMYFLAFVYGCLIGAIAYVAWRVIHFPFAKKANQESTLETLY